MTPEDPSAAFSAASESAPLGVLPWSQVKRYIECPQRFWYGARAGLKERGDRSYPRFHAALYGSLALVADRASRGQGTLSAGELRRDLDARFDEEGVGTAGQAAVLRQSGHGIAALFAARLGGLGLGRRLEVRPWVRLPVGGQVVGLRPAELEFEGDRPVVARVHFFKPRSDGHDERPEVALLYAALGSGVCVELWYPLDGTDPRPCALEARRPEALSAARSRKEGLDTFVGKKVSAVQQAITGIEAGRFDPAPDDHVCDGCGFQYACPGIR